MPHISGIRCRLPDGRGSFRHHQGHRPGRGPLHAPPDREHPRPGRTQRLRRMAAPTSTAPGTTPRPAARRADSCRSRPYRSGDRYRPSGARPTRFGKWRAAAVVPRSRRSPAPPAVSVPTAAQTQGRASAVTVNDRSTPAVVAVPPARTQRTTATTASGNKGLGPFASPFRVTCDGPVESPIMSPASLPLRLWWCSGCCVAESPNRTTCTFRPAGPLPRRPKIAYPVARSGRLPRRSHRKPLQLASQKAKLGPAGRLESRTRTLPLPKATSTQFPGSETLLLRQMSSGRSPSATLDSSAP